MAQNVVRWQRHCRTYQLENATELVVKVLPILCLGVVFGFEAGQLAADRWNGLEGAE